MRLAAVVPGVEWERPAAERLRAIAVGALGRSLRRPAAPRPIPRSRW